MEKNASPIRLYGRELRELRRDANVTQAQLAEALGTYQQVVSLVERGWPADRVLPAIERARAKEGEGAPV